MLTAGASTLHRLELFAYPKDNSGSAQKSKTGVID